MVLQRFALAVMAALLVAGCGGPMPQAAVPTASGGLGLTREQWEGWRGGGTKDPISGYTYQGGYLVSYQNDPAGVSTVWTIEQQRDSLSIEDTRTASKNLIPSDSVFVRTYNPAQGRIVDLYTSAWLKDRLPPSLFVGGEPGSFIVLYRLPEGRITSIVIAPGNNP